jgi:hypothetical protein
MHLAWTAILPRTLVDAADFATLAERHSQILTVHSHPDPRLYVVRCYRRDRRLGASPAA